MKCVYCGSNTIKSGKSKRKKRGYIQIYTCKKCRKHFIPKRKGYCLKYGQKFINKVLEYRQTGMSYKQIADKLKSKVSVVTMYRWNKKFGKNEGVKIAKIWRCGYWGVRGNKKMWVKGRYYERRVKI